MNKCVYCNVNKKTVIWKETGEEVCKDCRYAFLVAEFEDDPKKRIVPKKVQSLMDDWF